MVLAGNNAKRLSPVNHTTKTIHLNHHLSKISLKTNLATDEDNGRNEKLTLNKEIKLE